jgi:hypothetical protein
VLGVGGYIVRGGAVPTASEPTNAATPKPSKTTKPSGKAGLPGELALADPDEADSGELEIMDPASAIEALPEAERTLAPATTRAPATTTTVPPTTTSTTTSTTTTTTTTTIAPTTTTIALPQVRLGAPVGRFSTGACVEIKGIVNSRARRVANASMVSVNCADAHNAEVVWTNDPSGVCEALVATYIGYNPKVVTKIDGTGIDYALVQDKLDQAIYCIAGFKGLPDYTGQVAGSKAS